MSARKRQRRRQRQRRPWKWVTKIRPSVWLVGVLAAVAVFVGALLAGRGTAALLCLFVAYVCAGGYADSLRARRAVRRRSARKSISRKGGRK